MDEKKKARKKAWNEKNRDRVRAYQKAWHEKNREKVLARQKAWREANREKEKAYQKAWREANREKERAASKAWREANREKELARRKAYKKRRLKTDPQFKLSKNLRRRLHLAIKNDQKVGSAIQDLGCSVEYLKAYLEGQFEPGMTWENWAPDGWHIDHIRPLSTFDLTDPEQFKQAVHYTNLQPLWAKDNLKKGQKVISKLENSSVSIWSKDLL